MARGGRGGGFSGGGRGISGGGMRGSSGRGSLGAGRGGRGTSPLGGSRPSGGAFGGGRPPAPRQTGGWGAPRGGFWSGMGLGWTMGRGPRRVRHVHHHHGGGPGGSGGGCGCGTILAIVLVLVLITVVIASLSNNGFGSNITPSTIERTPLPQGSALETSYYTDRLGWIRSGTVLETGMRNFFQRTGVHPHLYITDTVNGTNTPSQADMEAYAMRLYDEIFDGEAHLLLLFHEYPHMSGNFQTRIITGVQASTVIDAEARDILLDYIDRYYFYDMDEDEFFSRAFNDASVRIMSVNTSPWPFIAGGLVVVMAAAVAFIWWSRAKAQKNLEAEQARAILSTPLQELGGSDAGLQELKDKYQE